MKLKDKFKIDSFTRNKTEMRITSDNDFYISLSLESQVKAIS